MAFAARPVGEAGAVTSGGAASCAGADVPNLVDERFEHDSCGVGFVASLSGEPSHLILQHALTALARLAHRGATAADGKSSDGVGLMTAVPRAMLLKAAGVEVAADATLGVGACFWPATLRTFTRRWAARASTSGSVMR